MNSAPRVSTCLINLICLLILCAPTYGEHKYGKVTDEEWQMGAPEAFPEAGAIILFDIGHMHVTTDIIETDYHIRMKVLTSAGAEEIGEQSIGWYTELDKCKGFKAQTIAPDGKKYDVKGDAIFEKEDGDYKIKSFTFPRMEPGSVVEFQYTIRSKRFIYLKPWYFQNNIYTKSSEFSVLIDPGFDYNVTYQLVPIDKQEPEVKQIPDPDHSFGGIRYIKEFAWHLEELPAIKDEPYMSCKDDFRSAIKFQLNSFRTSDGQYFPFLQSWTELGELQQKDFDNYNNKRNDIKRLAEEVTAGLPTDREKSMAIYRYVTSNFATLHGNYNSWFINDNISKMLEEKSESGEGKNLLLSLMHNAVGIQAWPVMISTRDHARFNPQYPSLQQFNYIICFVQLADTWEFLDAAVSKAPYGLLPPNCLTDGGFLIDGNKSDLVRITIKPTQSIRADTTHMRINDDGLVACSTVCRFSGYYASDYGARFDRNDPEDFIDDYFIDQLDAECTTENHECGIEGDSCFFATLSFTSDELVEKLDNNMLVTPVGFSFNRNPFKSEKRNFPVDFTYPRTYQNVDLIEVVDSSAVHELPQDIAYQIGGATFTRVSKAGENGIAITSTLQITDPLFLPMKYGGLREFFEKIAQASGDVVVLSDVSKSE